MKGTYVGARDLKRGDVFAVTGRVVRSVTTVEAGHHEGVWVKFEDDPQGPETGFDLDSEVEIQ